MERASRYVWTQFSQIDVSCVRELPFEWTSETHSNDARFPCIAKGVPPYGPSDSCRSESRQVAADALPTLLQPKSSHSPSEMLHRRWQYHMHTCVCIRVVHRTC